MITTPSLLVIVITAGNQLTSQRGHDTNMIGGQLKGERVKADVGNNLTIKSLQESDNYDYDKLSGSVSGSGGVGAVTGEAAADIIREQLYGNKNVKDLSEANKENISALAQLAAGLAVAAGSGGILVISAQRYRVVRMRLRIMV